MLLKAICGDYIYEKQKKMDRDIDTLNNASSDELIESISELIENRRKDIDLVEEIRVIIKDEIDNWIRK